MSCKLNILTVLLFSVMAMFIYQTGEAETLEFKKIADAEFPIALCYYDKDTILFTEKSGAVIHNSGILA